MDFNKEKKEFLEKKDKSTKGSWDEDIIPLLSKINTLENYFTTSSCSGRIVLLSTQDKKESEWLFVSHKPVEELEIKQDCWFLQEPPIVHIRCKDLSAAEKLLDLAHNVGLKRAGLVSLKSYTIEVRGNERIEVWLKKDLPGEYIKILLDKANEKLLKSRNVFKKLEDSL